VSAATTMAPEMRQPTRYHDNAFGCEAVKILPGEYFATDRDMALVTVLGSCVAACVRDPVAGVGGMNHFMLPNDDALHPTSRSARYGAYAMEVLINKLMRMGAKRDRLEAKVFGGGAVVPGLTQINIGEANANFAIEYLRNERIAVSADDLMGTQPRKVYFFPRTGKALVRMLRTMRNNTILEREQSYSLRLKQLPSGGDIELFK
jgi:chemotaxis protein CheD